MTIAADVKRFCHQINTDGVFGTHTWLAGRGLTTDLPGFPVVITWRQTGRLQLRGQPRLRPFWVLRTVFPIILEVGPFGKPSRSQRRYGWQLLSTRI
jgi:hypothetical protein